MYVPRMYIRMYMGVVCVCVCVCLCLCTYTYSTECTCSMGVWVCALMHVFGMVLICLHAVECGLLAKA